MDTAEITRNNGYLGPVSFSVDLLHTGVCSNSNWGVPLNSGVVVKFDPQVDRLPPLLQSKSDADEAVRTEMRRIRRKLMSDLSTEFSTSLDDVLQELAR